MITAEQKNKYSTMQKKFINSAFTQAALEEDLELMQYLLTSQDLKYNADIHTANDFAFTISCQNGNLKAVKYLLTSPELKEHANLHAQDDYGLRIAVELYRFKIVEFLLTSPELKEHANVYADNNYALNEILVNLDANPNNSTAKKILSFLVNDYKIEKDKVANTIENYPKLEELIDKRDNTSKAKKKFN